MNVEDLRVDFYTRHSDATAVKRREITVKGKPPVKGKSWFLLLLLQKKAIILTKMSIFA